MNLVLLSINQAKIYIYTLATCLQRVVGNYSTGVLLYAASV